MVMGAWLLPKDLICCGTLSSRMRKLPRGMLGMKWPFLSRTATSILTRLTSLLKLGWVSGRASGAAFLLSLEGMGASSGSPAGLRGLATVWSTSLAGPGSWARETMATAQRAARVSGKTDNLFQDFMDIRMPQVNYSKRDAGGRGLVSGAQVTTRTHSWRRAVTGLIRMARRAGIQQATAAIESMRSSTIARVNGSVGCTP